MKIEFNLNNIIFLILIIILSIWGGRQFLDKRSLKREINSNIGQLNNYKKILSKTENKLIDSVSFYEDKVDYLINKHENYKKQKETREKIIIDSIYKLSIKESKKFIDSTYSNKKGDSIYIMETQLKDIHISTLKLKECEELSNFQQETIEELNKAYSNCLLSSNILKDNLSECSKSNEKNKIKIKSLKRKVWSNRIITLSVIGLFTLL
jgi:D-ribose pyranose/furanose isomerase RbsD